jgi:hypothetical protein
MENKKRVNGRVRDDEIILYDNLPGGVQDLKSVVIIRGNQTQRRVIRRTRKGGYLFQ